MEEKDLMIVTCEHCKTRFSLDSSRLRGPESRVRCSRCGHVFVVSRPEQEAAEADFFGDSKHLEKDFSISPPLAGSRIPPTVKKSSGLKSALFWIVPLLLLIAGAFWFVGSRNLLSSSEPVTTKRTSPAETIQPAVTISDSTQAYFLENEHAGQIFVVEGEVNNDSDRPVSFILLEGKLYSTENHVAQSQRCFCGNVISREELLQMNVADIQNRMMNREGKDLMNVHIPPGHRVPFMLVFHNLPDLNALSDYSIEVISAETD